jgi:hypothetical protein
MRTTSPSSSSGAFRKLWQPQAQTPNQRDSALRSLRNNGKPTFLADQQVATACVTLAMQAMERGFNATDMPNTWRKINDQMRIGQKFYGTDLQIMLQQLGWKIYYWNPDPSKNAEWDAEDKKLNPPNTANGGLNGAATHSATRVR